MSQFDIDEIEAFSLTTRLGAPARAGATTIRLRAVPVGIVGATLIVGAGTANLETVTVAAANERDITLGGALANDHEINEAVIRLDILQDYAPEAVVSVRTYGLNTTNTGAENDAALAGLLAAIAGTRTRVVFPAGTFAFDTGGIDWPDYTEVVGAGMDRTILDFSGVAGVAMYAIAESGRFDGFTILGDDTPGSVGIQADDTHIVSRANWGTVKVEHMDTGVSLTPNAYNGFYYNHFGILHVTNCGTYGLQLESLGAQAFVGDNDFTSVYADNCGAGVYVRLANSFTIGHLSAQNNTTGLDIDDARDWRIKGGAFESNTTDINIGANVYALELPVSLPNTGVIAGSVNADTSCILPYTDGGTRTHALIFDGRWWANRFTMVGERRIDDANLQAACIPYTILNAGATPSVDGYNSARLDYAAPTAITGFTGMLDNQLLILLALNANASIAAGGDIHLNGNWTPDAYDTLILLHLGGTQWVELSRSPNT